MNDQIIQIFLRSLRGDVSAEEQRLLQQWAEESPEHQALLDEFRDPGVVAQHLKQMNTYDADKAWRGLRQNLDEEQAPKTRSLFYRRFWTAAAVLLIIAGTSILYLLQRTGHEPAVTVYKGNVMPGRDGAKLRLSNGSIVTIDSLRDGLISSEGSIDVFKENGTIIYRNNAAGVMPQQTIAYNEIIADKGRKTMAELPDGSVVWVNAGSSVRYPLPFSSNERLVTMTGEASFRVIHNDKQPFRVKVKGQLVEDIGTEFNINAYDDEEMIRTTLVEGSASITAGHEEVILKKGQESENRNGHLRSGQGNIEKAIAWRNGLFSFDHADLKTVLRQFTRWYDVEVRYEAKIPDETFTGEMERNLTLSDALDNLKRMHVKFRIEEDKRIVVLP